MTLESHIPLLSSDLVLIDEAYRIATTDILRSITDFRDGLLDVEAPVFMAGEWYTTPWTRDASINVWNGAGLLYPAVAQNTLRSVLQRRNNDLFIGGEYWDAIIWTIGAWTYYLQSGDLAFLAEAFEATRNSLSFLETTEFSPKVGLFRGPAVYGDGVAAYPDVYTHTDDRGSSIKRWVGDGLSDRVSTGQGLPMHALSTNCIYVEAYRIAIKMANELGHKPDAQWAQSASSLSASINKHFWMQDAGRYRYLVDPFGGSDAQEALGHAFALMFDIADGAKAEAIVHNIRTMPAGIPCLWPSFERYGHGTPGQFGRHSGTVWPPIQALWAEAAARNGDIETFQQELFALASHAVRDGQFFEIYHPETGLPYGGLQERHNVGIVSWEPMPHQTWSATAFLRMTLATVIGLRFGPTGLKIEPVLPDGMHEISLRGLRYRSARLDIAIRQADQAKTETEISINGRPSQGAFIGAKDSGEYSIEIALVSGPPTAT